MPNLLKSVLFCCCLLAFYLIDFTTKNVLAVTGYTQDDGTCIAYYYRKHVGKKRNIDGYLWSYLGRQNGIPIKVTGDRVTNTSPPYNCSTDIGLMLDWYKWAGAQWVKIGYFHWGGYGLMEVLPISCDSVTYWPESESIYQDMASLGVPENMTPAQYWPNGPPAGCADPPPDDASREKNFGFSGGPVECTD